MGGRGKSMTSAQSYSEREATECGAQNVKVKNLEVWVVAIVGLWFLGCRGWGGLQGFLESSTSLRRPRFRPASMWRVGDRVVGKTCILLSDTNWCIFWRMNPHCLWQLFCQCYGRKKTSESETLYIAGQEDAEEEETFLYPSSFF